MPKAMRETGIKVWTLEGQEPVLCDDLMAWAVWLETHDRHVAYDPFDDEEPHKTYVSTLFMGIETDWHPLRSVPLLFETIVFRKGEIWQQERYRTWGDAAAGHQVHLQALLSALAEET